MNNRRSPVTYSARAKLLNLIDGKLGVFFKSHSLGSLEIHFLDECPKDEWVLIENQPMVFVDEVLYLQLTQIAAIDFDFQSQEFIVRKEK